MTVETGYEVAVLTPDGRVHVTCTETSNIDIVSEALRHLRNDTPAMEALRSGQHARIHSSTDGREHEVVLLPHSQDGELVAVSILSAERLLEHLPHVIERVQAELKCFQQSAWWTGSAERNNSLTQRQLSVLAHMAQGRTNGEIAKAICFSESTVRMETISIYRKLHVSGRKEAVAKARELGLLDTKEPSLVPA